MAHALGIYTAAFEFEATCERDASWRISADEGLDFVERSRAARTLAISLIGPAFES